MNHAARFQHQAIAPPTLPVTPPLPDVLLTLLSDVGGLVILIGDQNGVMAEKLRDEKGAKIEVWDREAASIRVCRDKVLPARMFDPKSGQLALAPGITIVLNGPRIFERTDPGIRERVLAGVAREPGASLFLILRDEDAEEVQKELEGKFREVRIWEDWEKEGEIIAECRAGRGP